MSEVQRYAVIETALCIGGNLHEGEVLMVRADEHDRELAALREDNNSLSERFESVCAQRDALREELARYQEGNSKLVDRLEAAEQRNATLIASIVALPDDFKELSGCENTAGVYACIDYISDWVAELSKESGESK